AIGTFPGQPVLYIDCGLFKQAREIREVVEWFGDRCDLRVLGFEASGDHLRDACSNLHDIRERRDLDLRQCALVGPNTTDTEVKLYKGSGSGRADSLHAAGRDDFEVVPAVRLSRVLQGDYATLLASAPVLLRMNIEGSEDAVI